MGRQPVSSKIHPRFIACLHQRVVLLFRPFPAQEGPDRLAALEELMMISMVVVVVMMMMMMCKSDGAHLGLE